MPATSTGIAPVDEIGIALRVDIILSTADIDTHVRWLRQKLEDDPQAPRFIRTIWGKGYRFHID